MQSAAFSPKKQDQTDYYEGEIWSRTKKEKKICTETNSSDILQFSFQLLQLNTENTTHTETQRMVYKESNEKWKWNLPRWFSVNDPEIEILRPQDKKIHT